VRSFKFEGYDIIIPDPLAEDYELPPDFQEWFNGEPFHLMLEMLSVSSLKAKDPAEEIQKFYKHIRFIAFRSLQRRTSAKDETTLDHIHSHLFQQVSQ
jgi:hypothetical protein